MLVNGERIAREFNVDPLVGEPFFRFVHPRRQIYIKYIYEKIPLSVDEMWVYGSVVTPNHYSGSDLDILMLGAGISAEDMKAVSLSYYDAVVLDNWNTCKQVHIIYDTPEEFENGRKEWGHCYWYVWEYGIKYFDRKWFGE